MRGASLLALFIYTASTASITNNGHLIFEGYHQLSIGPVQDHKERAVVESLRHYEGERKVVFLSDEIVTRSVPVKLVAHPSLVPTISRLLKHHHIPMEITDSDVQRNMNVVMAENKEMMTRSLRDADQKASKPNYYMSYEEQIDWLNQIASENADADTFNIGESEEGRPIIGIVINGDSDLPLVWIDAGIHAREWLGHATALWIIYILLTSSNADVLDMRHRYKWYIAPNINPDGYAWTHSSDRLWRKNRSPNDNPDCIGTDLNRNWDSNWGGTGSDPSPCSDTYHGSAPFSEAETIAVSSYLRNLSSTNTFYLYIGIHCFSQFWLVPWGGFTTKPSDYTDLMEAGRAAVNAIQATYNTTWVLGTPPDILYVASGGVFDWIKGTVGVKYAYTPELRPGNGKDNGAGFVQPATEIQPSGTEIWNGIHALVKYIDDNFKQK